MQRILGLMMPRLRLKLAAAAGTLVLSVAGMGASPPAVAAAGDILYVDGKGGSDSNDGSSWAEAFKTIAAAAQAIPRGSAPGWTVVVKGYSDYVYRERPVPAGFRSYGASGQRISFEAAGWEAGATNYVRPIVSGADRAPASGSGWHSFASGVYWTAWPNAPQGWGVGHSAVFQDQNKWLWNASSLSALVQGAAHGDGGYWWDNASDRLYVAPLGGGVGGHTFDVVMRQGFYFRGDQDVAWVAVRGFRVEHSSNGIAFTLGADHGLIEDNVLVGNVAMGILTNGLQTPNGPDPSTGHTIRRNSASYSTVQGIKIDHGTTDTIVCGNTTRFNALQGIKVQGSASGQEYSGNTARITVCNNLMADQVYQLPWLENDNATGITLANGAQDVTVIDNRILNNGMGIHLASDGPGLQDVSGIRLEGNLVARNRRFGLNLFDGFYGNGGGTLLSTRNLYYFNDVGVLADIGVSNKSLVRDTIWGNTSHGVQVSGRDVASHLTVTKSIISGNGGQGVRVTRDGSITLAHDGIYGNDGGNLYGVGAPPTVNFQPPGFMSKVPANPDFLRIFGSSYQYTAGPGDTPIGAKW